MDPYKFPTTSCIVNLQVWYLFEHDAMLYSGLFFFGGGNGCMINVPDFIPSLNAKADQSKRMIIFFVEKLPKWWYSYATIIPVFFICLLYSFRGEAIIILTRSCSVIQFQKLLFICPLLTCSVHCLLSIFLSNHVNVTPLNASQQSTTEWHATSVHRCRTTGLFVSAMLPLVDR